MFMYVCKTKRLDQRMRVIGDSCLVQATVELALLVVGELIEQAEFLFQSHEPLTTTNDDNNI